MTGTSKSLKLIPVYQEQSRKRKTDRCGIVNTQTVRRTIVATMRLILALVASGVGAWGTLLQMRRRIIDADFAPGSIAFLVDDFGVFPCEVVKRITSGILPQYEIIRNGCVYPVPAIQLLSGWEEDFPDWQSIKWGRFSPARRDEVAENEFADHGWDDCESKSLALIDPTASWRGDQLTALDYASLAEEWESKPIQSEVLQLPLFEIAG